MYINAVHCPCASLFCFVYFTDFVHTCIIYNHNMLHTWLMFDVHVYILVLNCIHNIILSGPIPCLATLLLFIDGPAVSLIYQWSVHDQLHLTMIDVIGIIHAIYLVCTRKYVVTWLLNNRLLLLNKWSTLIYIYLIY